MVRAASRAEAAGRPQGPKQMASFRVSLSTSPEPEGSEHSIDCVSLVLRVAGQSLSLALGALASLLFPVLFLQSPRCLGALVVTDSSQVSGALHVMWHTVGAQ